MKIGNLDIGDKLILAPMAEITDSSFRKICKEHGVGLTFTQMVSADGVIKNNFDTLRFFSFNRSEKPIAVQLLGNQPEILGEATKEISKFKPDLIDLNAGCPVEKVTSNKMGSALLDDPKAIGKILRKMSDNSNGIPISIKIRLGKDKNRINILEVAKVVEDSGASVVFVHARTRADKYDSDPNWTWIKKVKESIKLPVVGNGSVFSALDAKNMIDETGCDSVMIARGALGNPFLFSRFNSLIKNGIDPGEPNINLISDTALSHINNLEREFGEVIALDKAKKHLIWYFKNQPGLDEMLKSVFAIRSLDALKNYLNKHTQQITSEMYSKTNSDEVFVKFKRKVLFWLAEEKAEVFG